MMPPPPLSTATPLVSAPPLPGAPPLVSAPPLAAALPIAPATLLVGAPPPPLPTQPVAGALISPAVAEPVPRPDLPAVQPAAVAVPENTLEDWSEFSGMAISMVVHSAMFLLLALLVPLADEPKAVVQIVSSFEEPDATLEEPEMVPIEIPLETLEEIEEPVPEVADADLADVETSGSFDPAEVAGFSGPLDDAFAGTDTMLAEFGSILAGGGGGSGGGFGGEIGRRLSRAGAKTGSIQISLSWNDFNDLDLHVVPPSEERISFSHRRSKCGGTLDVDMNAGGQRSDKPVENVFWSRKAAPAGTFKVYVHFFDQHDEYDETPFELHVLVDGVKTTYKGVAKSDSRLVTVTEFERKKRGSGTRAPGVEEFQE